MKIVETIKSGFTRQPRMSCVVIGLTILLFSAAFASNEDHFRSDTLATVGNKAITANDFVKLYRERLTRLGLTDNANTRLGYLMNLVDDEIMIKQAKLEKLDRTGEAADKKRSIETKILLDAYSAKHLAQQSEVTENDLRDLFIKMNKKIKVSHLYARSKAAADSMFNDLSHGVSFNEIAKRTFTDPKLKENGGSLGYISIDEMDPEFEKTAYGMRIGEISKPVKTVQGYSIIRVDDIKGNPFVTESEYLKVRDRLKGFTKKNKYAEALKQFTSDLRSKLNVQFDKLLINKLYVMSQDKSFKYILENRSFALSTDELKKTVLTSTTGKWSVNELIDALSKTTERQRSWIHSEENFEDLSAGLVLQRHIIREAKKEKLDASTWFRDNVNEAFDTYLLTKLEDRLKDGIRIPADSLHSYYARHMNDFMIPEEIRLSAILLDNASLSDSIKQLLEKGLAFPELAKRYSLQEYTAERGGDLGFYRREELGDYGQKLFSLKQGDWAGPLIENGKYLFIKCTERKDALQRSFESSKTDIEDMLVSITWINSRHQHAESLKKNIYCRVFPEKLRTITLH
jgi:foldase protein PrsA